MIQYAREDNLGIEEFKTILINSTLGERRPIHDADRLQKMLYHANLIITARENGKIIGVARSISDFVFCTYLSDLAVDENYQRQGIGKELIRQTKLISPLAKLILLSAPKAVDYYPLIGMSHFEHCYVLEDVNAIR